VTDPEAYQGYQALAPAAFAAYGAQFLVRSGAGAHDAGLGCWCHVLGQLWRDHAVSGLFAI
jgi:uncharacterized protein (DUF1330 family)